VKEILYIISDIDRSVFFEHTAIGIREKGFNISFVLINSKNSHLSKFLVANNFNLYHIEANEKLVFSWKPIITLIKLLRKLKPNIVHCHLAKANWIGLWASHILNIEKRIFTRHSGWPFKQSKKEILVDKIQNYLATDIVAISENTKQLLVNQGVATSKIHLIYHGFDLERMAEPDVEVVRSLKNKYNHSSKYPVIGIIARWEEPKGIQYTIKAFKMFLKEYPNALLLLFNVNDNMAYSKELNNLLADIPDYSYKKIFFESNIYDLYNLFDVYVHVPLNEKYEAFGQTYVEALAAGIPSVFTLSGIANEFIVNEFNALVVNYHSGDDIYKAIGRLVNEEVLREKIVMNGKNDVKRFNLNTFINNIISLYNLI
jgi:glycosyltransferase involved in cell wall biosynthesis